MIDLSSIPDSEKTPLVSSLIEIIESLSKEIQILKDEIARLKNHPKRPKLRPSKISQSEKKSSSRKKKPKSNKSQKKEIEVHNTIKLKLKDLPKGSKFLFYRDYLVQDIEFKSNNTKYRRAVYRLADGTIQMAELPDGIDSHFGVDLKSHIIYLHYSTHMTQPSILEYFKEHGIKISSAHLCSLAGESAVFLQRDMIVFMKRKKPS